jgi:nonribosomal peptide synthetase DhbF
VLLALRAGHGVPVFCVHPGAGISWVYAALLRHLAPQRPVYGLQARGLTEPDYTPGSLAEIVEDYLAQLRSVHPRGPYALVGWSIGGTIAFHLAARLQALGEEVPLLALLDAHAPAAPGGPRPRRAIGLDEVARSLGYRPDAPDGPLAVLAEAERAAVVRVFTDLAHLDLTLPMVRGDLLFFAAEPAPGEPAAPLVPWRQHITGKLVTHHVGFRHGELARPEAMAVIGPVIEAWLDGRR